VADADQAMRPALHAVLKPSVDQRFAEAPFSAPE
jgi:hypothetical protein